MPSVCGSYSIIIILLLSLLLNGFTYRVQQYKNKILGSRPLLISIAYYIPVIIKTCFKGRNETTCAGREFHISG